MLINTAVLALVVQAAAPAPSPSPRARDLGIPFDFGTPGKWNAITDVPGLEVGHVTLVEGAGVRTGITAVLPRGKGDESRQPCFAGYFSLNGNGEMTGVAWLQESGMLEGPVLVTNTNSVGVVRDAVISYAAKRWGEKGYGELWSLPVVAETWDGHLNDIYGMHVKREHAVRAIEAAASGPVVEGNVGGGTGMVTFEFKGGIGTSSRVLSPAAGGYTVGVLVQSNFGLRHQMKVAGLPIGQELRENLVYSRETGSIIILLATDAPLLPHQLERLSRRASLGLARTGSVAGNGSGDLFLAFSTAPTVAATGRGAPAAPVDVRMVPNDAMGPLFEATVGATEEAIVNALVAARTMTGHQGHTVHAVPHDRLQEILRRHRRLRE